MDARSVLPYDDDDDEWVSRGECWRARFWCVPKHLIHRKWCRRREGVRKGCMWKNTLISHLPKQWEPICINIDEGRIGSKVHDDDGGEPGWMWEFCGQVDVTVTLRCEEKLTCLIWISGTIRQWYVTIWIPMHRNYIFSLKKTVVKIVQCSAL